VTYYILDDFEHRGTLIRSEGRKSFEYDKNEGWVRTGIMAQYRFPDSPVYESYHEITEEEANKLIEAMK
jgi:hypothetical protein